MPSLAEKYPEYRQYISKSKAEGFSDFSIERALARSGAKPAKGAVGDSLEDSSFLDVLGEKFDIDENESLLDFIGDIAGLPQAVATASFAQLFGSDETFAQQVSRNIQPSEFLPEGTPGSVKFVADIVADPLNLTIGAGVFKKIATGLKAGQKVAKGATAARAGKEVAEEAPEIVKSANTFMRDIIDTSETGLAMNLQHVSPKFQAAVRDTWKGLVQAGKIEAKDPKKTPLIHQFVDAVAEGKIDFKGDVIDDLVRKGYTKEQAIAETMGFFQETVSQAGRTLASQRVFLKRLHKAMKDDPNLKAYGDALAESITDIDNEAFLTGWRRFDNVRRGLLVTQFATAQRNFMVQTGRVGLDVLEQGFQWGLQRVFGRPQTTHFADQFGVLMEMTRQLKNPIKAFKGQVTAGDKILDIVNDPRLKNRLITHYSSDILVRGEGKVERAVHALNIFNRFQENLVRRAVFTSKLKVGLRNEGLDLAKIIATNDAGAIPQKLLKTAMEDALEFTFAAQPKYGTVGHAFVNFINKMPGATFAIPFPRFLVNSIKYFIDYSPAGFAKLLGQKQWTEMAAGNFRSISRAMLGTGMLGAAWGVRNSEWAGERWYEIKLPGGETWDTRAFNPFVAYLFAADMAKRAKEGTLHTLNTKDILMGVLSSNLRAGTGLYLLDSFLEGIVGLRSGEKLVRRLKTFTGEVVGGFFTPLQMITDLYSEFDANQEIIRDRRMEPFMGPIKARIPVVSQQLPPLESATREADLRRVSGGLRQITGISLHEPKNAAERELDRLGFTFGEIVGFTGQPEADRLMSKYMGPLVEERIPRLLSRKSYQRLGNAGKGEQVRQLLNKLRAIARKRAKKENPEIFKIIQAERLPRRRRRFLEEITEGRLQ